MLGWPNRITITRIALIPLMVLAAIWTQEDPVYRYWTLGIFALLAVTDALDGFLARVLNQRTALGTFLDPLADKLLLATACVLVAIPIWPTGPTGELRALIPAWVAVVVLSRDIYLALGMVLTYVMGAELKIQPTFLGKATTNGQVIMVVAALVPQTPPWGVLAACWLAAGLTVASWIQYTYTGTRTWVAESHQ